MLFDHQLPPHPWTAQNHHPAKEHRRGGARVAKIRLPPMSPVQTTGGIRTVINIAAL
jgi:hypothetical protein